MERSRQSPDVSRTLRGIYREVKLSDFKTIALWANKNNLEVNNLWCRSNKKYTEANLIAHYWTLKTRGLGKTLTQTHQEDGIFLSYFAGYTQRNTLTLTTGVINLDEPDPKEIWRKDARILFNRVLEQDNIQKFRISSSSDQGWHTEWIEKEVGMKRVGNNNLWIADSQTIRNYINPPTI